MAQISALLELRNQIKSKKPHFIRQDYQRRKRLGRKLKWKKPKGIHSKIRHHFKGRMKMPSPGYGSPSEVKWLHSSGLKMINIATVKEISNIDNEQEGVIISKNVGLKKKLEILKKAKELDVHVLNLNADEQIKKIDDFVNSKKKSAKETKKEVPKESAIKESKKEEKKDITTDEQKKEAEKKEKDKILTKRA